MTRNYRASTRNSSKNRGGTRGWVWFLSGLTLGFLISLMIYLGQRQMTSVGQPLAAATPAPPAQAGASDNAEVAKPRRFDFYTLLPELEVVVPDAEQALPKVEHNDTVVQPETETAEPVTAQPATSGRYILQAGSFQNAKDADGLKASLALLGVEASIQTVDVNNSTWHRVRVGPYTSIPQVDKVRARLRANRIETLLVKERK